MDLSQSLQGAGGVGGLLAVSTSNLEPRTSNQYYTTYDANGNVSEYIDSSGNAVAHYEYSPFGKLTNSSGSKAGDFSHRFSTKYRDTETGLYYYGYRYYSAELGRWLSRDPLYNRGFRVSRRAFGLNFLSIPGSRGAAGWGCIAKVLQDPHTERRTCDQGKNPLQYLEAVKECMPSATPTVETHKVPWPQELIFNEKSLSRSKKLQMRFTLVGEKVRVARARGNFLSGTARRLITAVMKVPPKQQEEKVIDAFVRVTTQYSFLHNNTISSIDFLGLMYADPCGPGPIGCRGHSSCLNRCMRIWRKAGHCKEIKNVCRVNSCRCECYSY